MSKYRKLSHVVYKCDYHLVWTPKYRYRLLEGVIKDLVESDIKKLIGWKGCEILELSVQSDHIHLVISMPPKISISTMMGVLKGKLAIKIFKSYPNLKQRPYWGNHFWARGYFASTVGIDEAKIRRYVKYQEEEEKKEEKQQRKFDF